MQNIHFFEPNLLTLPLFVQVLLMAFVVLQVLDALSTLAVLSLGGIELNPLMRFAMKTLGVVPGLFLVKFSSLGLVLFAMDGAAWVWLVLNAVYCVVVHSNIRCVRQLLQQSDPEGREVSFAAAVKHMLGLSITATKA